MRQVFRLFPGRTSSGVVPASLAATLCLICGLWVTSYVGSLVDSSDSARARNTLQRQVLEAEARLQGRVREIMSLGQGLEAYLAVDPEIDRARFETFTERLLQGHDEILSLHLSRGARVAFSYPRGAEPFVLGENLDANPDMYVTLEAARESSRSFLSDARELRSGDRGIMVEVPIHLPLGQSVAARRDRVEGTSVFWGLASFLVDESQLFQTLQLSVEPDTHVLRVERADTPPRPLEEDFPGDMKLATEVARISVSLPTLAPWDIVMYRLRPDAGQIPVGAMMAHFFGIAATLLISVLSFFLVHEVFQVRGLALHDTLTGLANRRLLEERINQLSRMVEREGRGYDLFYLDLDGFKPINDTYGHEIGDLVLREVARRLSVEIRNSDTAARIGGDEFVILTCNRMEDEARLMFVERLRSAIRAPIAAGAGSLSVDVSIGMSRYPEDGLTAQEILRSADQAMYLRKGEKSRPRPKPTSPTSRGRGGSTLSATALQPVKVGVPSEKPSC